MIIKWLPRSIFQFTDSHLGLKWLIRSVYGCDSPCQQEEVEFCVIDFILEFK